MCENLKAKKLQYSLVFSVWFSTHGFQLIKFVTSFVVTSFEICFVVVLLTLNVQNALLHTWYFTKIKLVAVKNIG